MSDPGQERRNQSRNTLALSVVVKGRESTAVYWNEVTEVVNVSRLGANFNLERECPAGSIVSLILKMPENLRCYDLDKSLYRVWGLVQHCSPISHEGFDGYQIGVAFVGKDAPESYHTDPLKTYRISGMNESGFWHIDEAKTPFVARAHYRFAHSVDARIAVIDPYGKETETDEGAKTVNIGEGGTAVYSSLELNTGDCVTFTVEEPKFSCVCIVRNRQTRKGAGSTLHLEFSDADFPVQKIDHLPQDIN
jgi:hypothetical protein